MKIRLKRTAVSFLALALSAFWMAAPNAAAQGFQRPATGGAPAGPGAAPPPAVGGAHLQPGKTWVKEEIKILFLPESETVNVARDLTTALSLQPGQIATFRSSLMVWGEPEDVKSVKRMVAEIDRVPRHIIFEATLINVDTDRVKEIGSELLHSYKDQDSDKTHTVKAETDFGIAGNFKNTVVWTFDQGGNKFDLTAGFLLERGAAEIVSKPVVRVRDGGAGEFKIVTNVPQKTVSDKGTRVEYKATGITIKVDEARIIPSPTPTLSKYDPDYKSEMIWAALKVTDGTIGLVTTEGITTNDTEVVSDGYYESGDTLIIASLVKDTRNERKSFVPGMYKIPLIGQLFERKTSSIKHTETIILVRPTIEVPKSGEVLGTHELMASHFESSQDQLSIKLGGRNRDSITVHPFSDAKWKSVPAIYDPAPKNALSYWKLAGRLSQEEVEAAAMMFKKIRNRVGLILEQSKEQIHQQILQDRGLDGAMVELQGEFREKFGKEPPTAAEFLVAAAHHGVLNQWAFDIYVERIANEFQEKAE